MKCKEQNGLKWGKVDRDKLWRWMGVPGHASGKESVGQCRRRKRHGFDPWVRKIPWYRKWQPTIVFSPGKFHGQRRLAGYAHGVAKNQTRPKLAVHSDCYMPVIYCEVAWGKKPGVS